MRSCRTGLDRPAPDDSLLAPILDTIGEAIQIIDAEGNCLYINQTAADLFGRSATELLGKNLWDELPEFAGSPLQESCRRAIAEQVRIDIEVYFPLLAKWLEIHLHPTREHITLCAAGSMRGVHPAPRPEHLAHIEALNGRLQTLLEQARTMNEALILSGVRQIELTETADLLNARLHRAMQESHHRIKNNLQVISALIEIQIDDTSSAADHAHLKRINQHIRILASIHDMLTHQAVVHNESGSLSVRAILGRLVPMLQATSGGRPIKAEIEDVMLSTEKAASLSLLVSECISNAVKHGKGGIEVRLRIEGDRAHLDVCDDGDGFPAGFDWRTAANTGLALIDTTARHDLRGDVRFENHS